MRADIRGKEKEKLGLCPQWAKKTGVSCGPGGGGSGVSPTESGCEREPSREHSQAGDSSRMPESQIHQHQGVRPINQRQKGLKEGTLKVSFWKLAQPPSPPALGEWGGWSFQAEGSWKQKGEGE